MKRINVVGNTGTGKSTFAQALAEKLELAYIELDDLFWKNDWQESSTEEFLAKLEQHLTMAEQGWVVDGNYSRTVPIKWTNIDAVIWLDYAFHLNLYRSVTRALSRVMSQKPLWSNSNNRESFRRSFLSKDSIILWMLKHHAQNRQRYERIMMDPQYKHIQFIRLTSPKQAKAFLQQYDFTTI